MKKIVTKECLWCKKEFKTHSSFKEFCNHRCSDKSYYWYRKQGIVRTFGAIKCDVCKEMFIPLRRNCKRCSALCRQIWTREFCRVRNASFKKKRLEAAEPRTCIVCKEDFKTLSFRKTCGKVCALEFKKPKWRKKFLHEDLAGRAYIPEEVPAPTHDPIPVGTVPWPPARTDLQTATAAYLKNGGEIRKLEAGAEVDLLSDNPLSVGTVLQGDLYDQLTGTVRPRD